MYLVQNKKIPKPLKIFGIITKGPSIKDVSSEGEGGGYEKLQIGETFKA